MSEDRARKQPPEPPTVRPPFDPEAFARESDSKIRVESKAPPSARPTMPAPALDQETEQAKRSTSGTMVVQHPAAADTVPALAVSNEDLEWFELDPTAAVLLALVDGTTSVGELCERQGIPIEEGTGLVDQLRRQGLVTWR